MPLTLEIPNTRLDAGLYVVATPIGNLGDMTLRGLGVLAAADMIACEDTRITARLLKRYGITTPTLSYNDHNGARIRPGLLDRIARGAAVALVSDAGTPLVSDPGYKLVLACHEGSFQVTTVPGPSAVTAGLAVAGLPTDRFLFAGFPPSKAVARRKMLSELAAVGSTLVFFESARRLGASLGDMHEVLGPRPAAVVREISKIHEEVVRGGLDELAARFQESPPRGEITVIVGPPLATEVSAQDIDTWLEEALSPLSVKDAAARVAARAGLPRRQVYRRALELLNRP